MHRSHLSRAHGSASMRPVVASSSVPIVTSDVGVPHVNPDQLKLGAAMACAWSASGF